MDSLEHKTIAVLMGGLSPEREISRVSGRAVLEALRRQGLNAVEMDVTHQIAEALQTVRPDLAFVALHGNLGEDGAIQGLLEYLRIPYTGSGVLGSALAYNKVASKRIFQAAGIPTAPYEVFYRRDRGRLQRTLPLPVVVKPSDQGSSLGVSIVRSEAEWDAALDQAFALSEEVLVEAFIEGRLLAIAMREEEPLPIVAIRPKSGFYDYEAKYTAGKTDYECPADLTAGEEAACHDVAVAVVRALRGRGFPRVDVILSEGVPYVLEMNTIPGLTPTSLLPKSARQAGLEFEDLVRAMLESARLDYPEGGHS